MNSKPMFYEHGKNSSSCHGAHELGQAQSGPQWAHDLPLCGGGLSALAPPLLQLRTQTWRLAQDGVLCTDHVCERARPRPPHRVLPLSLCCC